MLNDNDAAGYEHADATAKLSLGIAKRVRRLDLANHWPEIPKGADVSDWLVAGHTREELAALIEAAPDYAASAEQPQAEPSGNSENADDTDAEIERLAKLSAVQYEQERKGGGRAARRPRVDPRPAWSQAERERLGLAGEDDGKQGRAISFPEPEPWPEPIDGAALLDGIAEAIGRYVIMSEHARHAAALWVVSHLSARLFLDLRRDWRCARPMKRCGKTTLLDVLGRVWCCDRCRPAT